LPYTFPEAPGATVADGRGTEGLGQAPGFGFCKIKSRSGQVVDITTEPGGQAACIRITSVDAADQKIETRVGAGIRRLGGDNRVQPTNSRALPRASAANG